MYSKKENIQQLISLLIQSNVSHIVISPGSRNMPLAESFYSDKSFHCYSVTDERSAGFFAIGLILKFNAPVAICCTSGSALLNYGSAISEAFYQELPLLVISADRPQAWIGQMDGQTLQQTNLFGNLVGKEVNLPIIKTEEDRWFCNRLINEALLFLDLKNRPVHINIPIDEPFFDCSAKSIPSCRKINTNRDFKEDWAHASRPLIIVGQLHPAEAKMVAEYLALLNCPILSENIGNIENIDNNIPLFDAILMNPSTEFTPDLVIYLGGHVISKRLKNWLRNLTPQRCWRIDSSDEIRDTFQCLTDIFIGKPTDFFTPLSPKSADNEYLACWKSANKKMQKKINLFNFSNHLTLRALKDVIEKIPMNSALFLGNSNTIRQTQFFLRKGISYFCNRGINGIDGSLSAAVGYAATSENQTFLIIGDLSFFYDMNALWNNHVSKNLHILLVNNKGGGIFKSLPGLSPSEAVNKLIITENNISAKGWAESVGVTYLHADGFSLSEDLIMRFVSPNDSPVLLELNCESERAAQEYAQFIEFLQQC